jgi:hypothetical protein
LKTGDLVILESRSDITQLQLTADWRDIGDDRLLKGDGYLELLLDSKYKDVPHDAYRYDVLERTYGLGTIWPLYSLRPSVNNVSHYLHIAPFVEDDELWPVRFEYEYGLRLIEAGAKKALLDPPVCFRQPNHVSTYCFIQG